MVAESLFKVWVEADIREKCFKKGEQFEFNKGVNVIVGDQGTGKSTLLSCLSGSPLGQNLTVKVTDKTCRELTTYFFDFEKMNLRQRDIEEFRNNSGTYRTALLSHFKSHGESTNDVLSILNLPSEDQKLFLLDEPCTSLSVRSVYKFLKILKEGVEIGHSYLISTHHLLVIESVDKVYSLEHRKWMTPKKFLNTQRVK